LPDQEIESDPSAPPTAEIEDEDDKLDIFKNFVDTLPFDDDEPEKE
jgi:hypothetical protein